SAGTTFTNRGGIENSCTGVFTGTPVAGKALTTNCATATAPPAPTPTPWTNIGGQLPYTSISAGSASLMTATSYDGYIQRWNGTSFAYDNPQVAMKQVSTGADGTLWGVKADDSVYSYSGSSWTQMPGALRQVSVGTRTNVWGVNSVN